MKIVHRRARHDYRIFEHLEAGIVLTGPEVKSLREGRGSLEGSFAKIKDDEVVVYNFTIPPYAHADARGYDPARVRKLLLHAAEITSLRHKMEGQHLTLIPLACYTTGRYIKLQLGLGKGKREYEKRETVKKRDVEREIARQLKVKS